MNLIKVLSEKIIRKISVGEFLNCPSLVLKELLENSIDASSNIIKINIINNGLSLINVVDNGIGIKKSDLYKSVQRNTTSKIYRLKDLNCINTFGFRGKALSGISYISYFSITSKFLRNKNYGWFLHNTKKDTTYFKKIKPMPFFFKSGTSVEVKDLFFNFHFKRQILNKFYYKYGFLLKKIISLFVLSNLNINFDIYNNNCLYKKYIFIKNKNKNFQNRIIDIYGKKFFSILNNILIKHEILYLEGCYSFTKKFKLVRIIFINKRIISNRNILYNFINNFFLDICKKNNFSYILYFYLKPNLINVNLDPRKFRIEIFNSIEFLKILYNLLYIFFKKDIISLGRLKIHNIYRNNFLVKKNLYIGNYYLFFLKKFGIINNFNKRYLYTVNKNYLFYIDVFYIYYFYNKICLLNKFNYDLIVIKRNINKIVFSYKRKILNFKIISLLCNLGFKIYYFNKFLFIKNIPYLFNMDNVNYFFLNILNLPQKKGVSIRKYILYWLSYYTIYHTKGLTVNQLVILLCNFYKFIMYYNLKINKKIIKIIDINKVYFFDF